MSKIDSNPEVRILDLALADYLTVWQRMQRFTDRRDEHTDDELWRVEHPPVFTLGLNGKREHLLNPGTIPVIPVDRGGQVTYHGPGQAILYLLLDLRRRRLGVRELVRLIEQSVIDLLAEFAITALARADAPGVYVDGAKIASLGLRVRRGCCYHGVALNVDMDLAPFSRINPCGLAGLPVTQLRDLGIERSVDTVSTQLARRLARALAD